MWVWVLCPLSCLCFGLSVVTCGSLRVLLRSVRINTPLQIEAFTRTIHDHILCLFCGSDTRCVFVWTQMCLYNKSCMKTYTYAPIHIVYKHSLESLYISLPRQGFTTLHTAEEGMPCGPKSISSSLILFPTSAICHSIMISLSLFFPLVGFSWQAA